MRKLKVGKLYAVDWHDTMAVEQWCDIDDIKNKARECSWKHRTIGQYVGTFHDYAVFAATVNEAVHMLPYANLAFIPVGVVRNVRQLS